MSESIECAALSAVIEERYEDANAELEALDGVELAALARQSQRLTSMCWRIHDQRLMDDLAAARKAGEGK